MLFTTTQVPAAATALLVAAFQILMPMLAFLYNLVPSHSRPHQQSFPVLLTLAGHAALIGLALEPQGNVLLAKHLPFSFRAPLVAAAAASTGVLYILTRMCGSC